MILETLVSWGTKLWQWSTAKNLTEAIVDYVITPIMPPIEKVGNTYKHNFDTYSGPQTGYQEDQEINGGYFENRGPKPECEMTCTVTCKSDKPLLSFLSPNSALLPPTTPPYPETSLPSANSADDASFDNLSADNSIWNSLGWLAEANLALGVVLSVVYGINHLYQAYNSRGAENNNNAVALLATDGDSETTAQSEMSPISISISSEEASQFTSPHNFSSSFDSQLQSLLAITETGEARAESSSTITAPNNFSASQSPITLDIKNTANNLSDKEQIDNNPSEGFWEREENSETNSSEQSPSRAQWDEDIFDFELVPATALTSTSYSDGDSQVVGGGADDRAEAPEGWDLI